MRGGDQIGQLTQIGVQTVEQIGQLGPGAVGADDLQVVRIDPAQPGRERDAPDDDGSRRRSWRTRSNWYTSDRGFSPSNSTRSATADTLILPSVRLR